MNCGCGGAICTCIFTEQSNVSAPRLPSIPIFDDTFVVGVNETYCSEPPKCDEDDTFDKTCIETQVTTKIPIKQGEPGPPGPQGPPGPKGDPGIGGDKNYVHYQNTSDTTWAIYHGLNKRPSVSVVDTAGTVIYAKVEVLDDDNIIINFNTPVSGLAILN